MLSFSLYDPFDVDDVTDEIVGPVVSGVVVSTVKVDIVSELLTFPAVSVTVIVQSTYVPSLKEFKVIVLFPEIAEVVLEEQEPP
jgi:hypothetical protein